MWLRSLPISLFGCLFLTSCDFSRLQSGKLVSSLQDLSPGKEDSNPDAETVDGPAQVGLTPPSSTSCDYYRNLWGVDDPYFCDQWHLINRGQKVSRLPTGGSFAEGLPGADIHAEAAKKNYDGENVRIYVTDDGLFSSHPDIIDNYAGGYNNCTGEANSTPPQPTDNHGTRVSGIIAARGGNGIGVTGIAPRAKLFVNNLVSSCQLSSSFVIKAAQGLDGFQLWTGSYGIPSCSGFIPRTQQKAIYDAFTLGAMKRNITYFKANGNDEEIDIVRNRCRGLGNTDPSNTHFAVASIAAVDHKGQITSYSSRGPNLSLAAFAGYGGGSSSPGIVTISSTSSYTSDMNGTSAATPVTTGSAALLVDAAPGLKWYDYQAILMRTATNIQEPKVVSSPLASVSEINAETNDAGYAHSINYGLGIVNIDKAIELATTSYKALPELKTYADRFSVIPSVSESKPFTAGSCSSFSVNIDNQMQIFSAEFSFDVTIAAVKHLALFVTTPKGKKFQLLRVSATMGSNLTYDQYFKSMQFFAMKTQGLWQVEACGLTAGALNGAKLNFYGFDGAPIPQRQVVI
jgi:subtilisin family serine protease